MHKSEIRRRTFGCMLSFSLLRYIAVMESGEMLIYIFRRTLMAFLTRTTLSLSSVSSSCKKKEMMLKGEGMERNIDGAIIVD